MKKTVWYKYTFADGTWSACRGMSRSELAHEVREHGPLISKVIWK